jgi:phage tail-like protein
MMSDGGYFYLNLENRWPLFSIPTGGLEIQPDGALALARQSDGTYTRRGVFAAGPFTSPFGLTRWRRLIVQPGGLPDSAHLRLFTLTSEEMDLTFDLESDNPFPQADGWQVAGRDILDTLIRNQPGTYLYVAGVIQGSGRATPSIRQMRVEYGEEPLLSELPEIYALGQQSQYLSAFLSMQGSLFNNIDSMIDDLPRLFDPMASPTGDHPAWFEWLSSWLAFDLGPNWTEAEARGFLSEAFEHYGLRGTVRGLQRSIKMYTGVTAHITEPDLRTPMWSLGQNSRLGFSTRLASAHLQGAVLDTTAALDQSHLLADEEPGAALFDDLAHRFCVHVYCSDLRRPGALDAVRRVVDREKPAHTTCQIHVIDPSFRVGLQARIGIDTIIAAGPPGMRIGMPLGAGALAEPPPNCPPGVLPQPLSGSICANEEMNNGSNE